MNGLQFNFLNIIYLLILVCDGNLQGLFVGVKFGNLNLPSLSDTIFSLNFKRPTICNRRAVVKFFVIYAVYSRLAVYIHESVI